MKRFTPAGMVLFVAGVSASACGGATRTGENNEGSGGSVADAGTSNTGGTGGGDTSLDVRDFDQSCDETSDCYVVRDGEQCLCGLCPTAAINVSAASRWQAESAALECSRDDCGHSILCGSMAYACRDDRCVVVDAPDIDPGRYDQTCRENEDCVVIPTGPWCTGCDCNAQAAISKDGWAKYSDEVNGLTCAIPDTDCGCPRSAAEPAVCVFVSGNTVGTCRLTPSQEAPRVPQE